MSVMHIPGHEHQGPREVSLQEIRDLMGNCQLCPLGQTRHNLVFGVGNPHARVMFVGEGPGRNEDLQGEPFVGAAGHKLDELLSYAGLTRKEVYIANVIKCRPPSNRNPRPEEIQACSPFLREQIRSIWPDVIVCLGNFASQFVLRTGAGVMSLRGRLHQRCGPLRHRRLRRHRPRGGERPERPFRPQHLPLCGGLSAGRRQGHPPRSAGRRLAPRLLPHPVRPGRYRLCLPGLYRTGLISRQINSRRPPAMPAAFCAFLSILSVSSSAAFFRRTAPALR